MRTLLRIIAFVGIPLLLILAFDTFLARPERAHASSGTNVDPYIVGTAIAQGSGTAVDIARPKGAIPGTLLFVGVFGASNTTFTKPTGWTLIGTRQVATSGSWAEFYYYMMVNGDEVLASWTGTLGGSMGWYAMTYAAAGIDQSSPLDASVTGNTMGAANPTLTAITTVTNNALVVAAVFTHATGGTFTPPAGMTERTDVDGDTFADVLQATAGTTGTKQFTHASDDFTWALVSFKKNTNASRFYFDGAAAPPISPAFGTGWEQTTTSVRRRMNATKGASAKANTTQAVAVTTNNIDQLNVQGVIGPLAAQTISGMFKGQLLSTESNAAANMHSQVIVRLVDSAGTEKAVLYSGDTTTGTTNPIHEFATTASNSHFPRVVIPRTLTSTGSVDGDYLVVEMGARKHNTSATSRTSTIRIGESATDLDEGFSTTDNAPWVEFLSGINLSGGATPVVKPNRSVIGPF